MLFSQVITSNSENLQLHLSGELPVDHIISGVILGLNLEVEARDVGVLVGSLEIGQRRFRQRADL